MAFENSDTFISNPESSLLSNLSTYEEIGNDSNKFENSLSEKSSEVNIIEGLFSLRDGIILNEKWENSYILSARINAVSEDFIACELIIDSSTKEIQIRNYPIKQFEHIPSLAVGKTVKIKINEKPGSFRVDIIDGSNTGIEKEFETLSPWNDLADFEMDNPANLND